MKTTPKTYAKPVPVALPITREELIAIGIPDAAIEAGEFRGMSRHVGPWQICVAYTALCVSSVYTPKELQRYSAERESETVFGMRTLWACRENGYALEGRVSVGGKTVRGFTSSQLFELPDGKLINCATIHACL